MLVFVSLDSRDVVFFCSAQSIVRLDESANDNFENGEWAKAFSQLPAALAGMLAAKVHIPSDVLEDRRRVSAINLFILL